MIENTTIHFKVIFLVALFWHCISSVMPLVRSVQAQIGGDAFGLLLRGGRAVSADGPAVESHADFAVYWALPEVEAAMAAMKIDDEG